MSLFVMELTNNPGWVTSTAGAFRKDRPLFLPFAQGQKMDEANCQQETLLSCVKGNSYERFPSDIFRSDFRIVGHVVKRSVQAFGTRERCLTPDLPL